MFLLIPVTLKLCARARPVREYDLHHTARERIPRWGGLALAGAFIGVELAIATLFSRQRALVPGRMIVLLASLAAFAIGFWDDLKPLGARKKLAAQIVLAALVYFAGLGIESFRIPFTGQIVTLHGWGMGVTIAWLVGITNLFNVIDGVDGLAGGIALMLMALLVFVGYANGTFVLLTAGMTGALLGFLRFNFPPARIYLGDGGAYFLGFQIGLFSIVGSHKGSVMAALIAPLFVLALPIVDASLAILRRGVQGLPILRPDRGHIHHRLLRAGLSRRQTVLGIYGFTLVGLAMGFVALGSRGELVPILMGLAVLALLLGAGKLSFGKEWFTVGRAVGRSLAQRQEIHYALALSNWLAHEGERCVCYGELYEDLVFAARRLGFTRVDLKLADGERTWAAPVTCAGMRSLRQELQGGDYGIFELVAPRCCGRRRDCASAGHLGSSDLSACPEDSQLFETMADLIMEAWLKAARKSTNRRLPLRFDQKINHGTWRGGRNGFSPPVRTLNNAVTIRTNPQKDP
jgi:UDP-GlcNAc:undecaprenyl-phosphate/decaprenyl-phosphate GlcNAc-1-phosphate transferase